MNSFSKDNSLTIDCNIHRLIDVKVTILHDVHNGHTGIPVQSACYQGNNTKSDRNISTKNRKGFSTAFSLTVENGKDIHHSLDLQEVVA